MSNGQYPGGQYPGAPPAKAGLPGWAKIAIGCGCLVLLIGAGVLGFMAWGAKKVVDMASDPAKMAEMVINLNPDLEVVENNADAGTMTIKDTKTGETTTISYADINEGKLTFEGKDGQTFSVDGSQTGQDGSVNITGPDGQKLSIGGGEAADVPSWVALYPNAKETTVGFRMAAGEEINGLVTQTTTDDIATVKKYYEDYFAREGYKITNTFSTDTADQKGLMMNAEKGTNTLAIVVGKSAGSDTSVNVTYKGPK